MNNKITLALALLLLVFVSISCQKDEDGEPEEQLMPLQVGNEWVYDLTDFDNAGNVLNKNRIYRAVSKDTLINRATYYVLNDRTIVRNTREGYVYYSIAGNMDVILYQSASYGGIGYGYQYPNYLLYVLTSRSTEQAPIVGSVFNLSGYAFEIKREYQQTNSSTITTIQKDYVAPGVGLVRSDTYYGDSNVLMRRQELVSYQLR
ncbi:hypothetical protein [Pontibacter oryzae]|uniref:Uncharacterized protein n=1 Tax=Pontibacter oryzae TaxID=2304593 RepID=A0A399SGN2_9BACT|nr:hypothetical protein [Pontibacter oryzae]RIJ41713.1 hypothetical protein D1627_06720 [Pontibacter oryzae]